MRSSSAKRGSAYENAVKIRATTAMSKALATRVKTAGMGRSG
jgi:hypothetical protein